jgi:anti-sigma regulatory factor (Ser/Thr protein kinase)
VVALFSKDSVMTTSALGPKPLSPGLQTAVAAALPVPVTLLAATDSAGAARRLLRGALEGHVGPEVLADVELLTTELVANAAVAAGDYCELSVSVPEPDVMRIAVTDTDPGRPSPSASDLMAEDGRGLRLVTALALRWGIDATAVGKTVWFEMMATTGRAVS